MSFQTDDLSMLVLGVLGDQPPDTGQPRLPDGLHCRWLFNPERGFPWHGFYLFRRESQPRQPRCLSPELRRFRPGPLQSVQLPTTLGSLSSARPLVFTEEFPPTGVVEVDLNQGALLRFDLPGGVEARRVDVRIGLRDAGPQATRTCVDFRTFPLGTALSPRTEKGAVFSVPLPPVSPQIALTAIEQWPGSPPGLQCTSRLEITLPCPATRVDLLLTNRMDLRIEALAKDGKIIATQSVVGQAAGTVTLTGPSIATVIVNGPIAESALLHQICWECPATGPGKGAAIEVSVLAGTTSVAHTVVQGDAGQVVAATLEGQGITAVQIGGGNAVLVDLCVWPSQQGVTFGWSEIPGFQYPLCLPVAHKDYPCPGKPATFEDAKTLALSRVTYPAPVGWDQGFPDLHGELVALVQGGPSAGVMADRTHPELPGQPLSPATQADVPKIPARNPLEQLPGFHPLELLLLASLQPAIAQMLGLYFVDTTAAPGIAYDYLLLADPTGVLGGSAATALQWIALQANDKAVDGYLVAGKSIPSMPAPPIQPPSAGKAYALPGPAVRQIDGTLPEVAGEVGLWWPLPADSTVDQPDRLIFYYPKRASLGPNPNPDPPVTQPADSDYLPLRDGSPVLVSEPDPPNPPVPPNPRSSDWPPPSIPLFLVDSNLAEGWYSYRFIGQDLFGRHSPLGPPASWYEWVPAEHQRHAFAVALLDTTPPSPPLSAEAWALDPPDRWVLQDEAYTKWRKDHKDVVGLRVRWRWTHLQQLQAPDTREFRLYYQPGRWNALLGRIVKVTAAATDQSDVDLDLADARAADAFAGARLRVGNDDFAILGSQPGAQLRLRVKNLGPHDEIPPIAGKPCTVAIPEKHGLWIDTSLTTNWAQRLAAVPYEPPARTVYDPSKDPNGQPLTHDNDAFQTVPVTVTGQDVLFGAGPNLSGVQPWIDHLWLQAGTAHEAHRIVRYDADTRTVTLEAPPALAGPFAAWVLGRPTREYDVFLPAPDAKDGEPFAPSLAEPAVYAQIAVSAADDKKHVADDPKWNDPARFGNESRLSPSATVFRVLQALNQVPDLPDPSERRYATPADYHSRSYTTLRFAPVEQLKVHVLRAVDDSLFKRDWLIRETRKALEPANAKHADFFPDSLDAGKRMAAAVALNALATGAPYSSLSDDAWAVLALLPGNEAQPDRTALETRDASVRHTRGGLTAADVDLFPKTWNPAQISGAVEALKKLADPTGYPALPDNALRVLAGLPGNEAAFTQVTLAPLEMADPQIRDERRPDDDAAYVPQPADIRAYTDTLPGRATNRYFYRARFVDGAQNQGSLSLAGPPVYLRKVEPPRAPVITKVVGGERQITLYWEASPEPDVVEYRVYRASSAQEADDVRQMSLVHSETAVANPPERPHWTDAPVQGLTTYFYRVLARDSSGFLSPPSTAAATQAYDQTPPEPPPWVSGAWRTDGGGIELQWSPPAADLETVVLRAAFGGWRAVSGWLPAGSSSFTDLTAIQQVANRYRLRVRNAAGNVNIAYLETAIEPFH